MGHVDLDPVGAVLDLLAGSFASFDGAVDQLCAFGQSEVGVVSFERVSAGHRDGAGNDEHAGPGDVSVFDGVADADITVSGALGLEIADGGESLLETAMGSDDGACGAIGRGMA